MKKKHLFGLVLIIVLATLMQGCGNTGGNPSTTSTALPSTPDLTTVQPTETLVTSTPDLCQPGYIEAEVDKVHKFMREFDDASMLAANMPATQLSESIANLQKIRRTAEDQKVPSCLFTLKTYQISHMNTVINTLLAFMGGNDQAVVDQGIALARQQHDQYTLELARVLGLTVVPAVTLSPTEPTAQP